MDLDRVLAFFAKYNPGLIPPAREIAEIGMHKARFHCPGLTAEEREFSRQWLTERGYRTNF